MIRHDYGGVEDESFAIACAATFHCLIASFRRKWRRMEFAEGDEQRSAGFLEMG
jgi:hypothetical protein